MISEEEYNEIVARLEEEDKDEATAETEAELEEEQFSEVVLVTTDGFHIKSYDCYGTSADNLTNLLNRGYKNIIEYPELKCVMLSLTDDPRDFLYCEDYDEMLDRFDSILQLSGRENMED